MRSRSLYSKTALCTAISILLVACGGCWEKIEYKGSHTPATETRAPRKPLAERPPGELTPTIPPAVATESPPTTSTAAADDPPPTSPPPLPVDPVSSSTTANANAASGDSSDSRYSIPGIVPSTPPPAADRPPDPVETPPAAATVEPRHTDATTASATAEVPKAALNGRRAAWLLGSRMSLAALAHDRGIAAGSVPAWLEDARKSAKFLGVAVADLPEPAAAEPGAGASRQVINYLLVNGQQIGSALSKQHGPQESALFEIALKSNILLLLYTPGSTAGSSISVAISKAAPQAKLPEAYWKPLVDSLAKQASQDDIRAAVRKMHVDVDQYLSQAAEPMDR